MSDCSKSLITITIPAGTTYYYDGKFGVITTEPHTNLDRYVTLKLIDGEGGVYMRFDNSHSDLSLWDYHYMGLGSEFWGEIDRCHMVRK